MYYLSTLTPSILLLETDRRKTTRIEGKGHGLTGWKLQLFDEKDAMPFEM